MTTVRQLLEHKGHDIAVVDADATVFEAIALMAERNIGSLLVMEDESLVGIVTERDYARKVVLRGKASPTTPVREVMSAHVITVSPDETVEECMTLMTDRRVRHLPVVEGTRLIGIISIGDLVQSIIGEQRSIIDHLEQYIRS
jgi:CBS domain-containing protein